MSVHHLPPRGHYQLRNDANIRFNLESQAQGCGSEGSLVKILITRNDGEKFRYEVIFRGEYSASKANFTEDMYLETALSVARSQLESRVHQDTRIVLEVNSGLPRTQIGVALDWDSIEAKPGGSES